MIGSTWSWASCPHVPFPKNPEQMGWSSEYQHLRPVGALCKSDCPALQLSPTTGPWPPFRWSSPRSYCSQRTLWPTHGVVFPDWPRPRASGHGGVLFHGGGSRRNTLTWAPRSMWISVIHFGLDRSWRCHFGRTAKRWFLKSRHHWSGNQGDDQRVPALS